MSNIIHRKDWSLTRPNSGFAALSIDERKKVASKGGKVAHVKRRAHEFTSDEARAAAQISAANRAQKAAERKLEREIEKMEGRAEPIVGPDHFKPAVLDPVEVTPEIVKPEMEKWK